MFKKSIFLILAILCVLSLTSMVMAQEKVTLEFMGWEASPLETESIQNGLDRFMKENPNIEVEFTPVPGDYAARLMTRFAGGSAPDVFFMGDGEYRDYVDRDVLLDLTSYFESSELNIEDFIPVAQRKMLVGDRVYGVSSCNVSPVLFYNKEVFDEAGLPYPPSDPEKAWTWDEFLDVAKNLTIEDGDRVSQYGVYGFEQWGLHFESTMLYSNEGAFFNDDQTEFLLNSPEAKEAFQRIKDLRVKHNVSPSSSILEDTGMNAAQMLQTGRVAMTIDGSWALQELASMDFPVGVGVLPKMKTPATLAGAHLHSVSANSEHPDESWELVKFLSSEWYQTQNIREGLWLPNRLDMYTEEGMKEWINPEVHPEGFENITKFITDYSRLVPLILIDNEIYDIIVDDMDLFFDADQPLDEVLEQIEEKVVREMNL